MRIERILPEENGADSIPIASRRQKAPKTIAVVVIGIVVLLQVCCQNK